MQFRHKNLKLIRNVPFKFNIWLSAR